MFHPLPLIQRTGSNMDTLGFLQRVLPTEGLYCRFTVHKDNPKNVSTTFYDTVDELAVNCLDADHPDFSVYYALSTFGERKRKQANAVYTKSLFVDIDCGPHKVNLIDKDGNPEPDKGYANQRLGLAALQEFIKQTGLPDPMIVSSGRGLHVYWVCEEQLSPDEWQPLANALKAAHQDFIFDNTVTADLARILRPVGTHHPSNGKRVTLLMDGPATSKQTFQNILLSASPTGVTDMATYVQPTVKPQSQLSANLTANIQPKHAPSNHLVIYNKCKQVEWAVDNQDNVSEPTWYALMGIAAFCHNADDVAKDWSKKHSNYNEVNTLKKMQQWKAQATGPATCAKFKDERKKGCANCPQQGNIKSPCQLGTTFAEVVVADADLPDGVDVNIKYPYGFKYTGNAIVQAIDGTDIEVCPFDIRPVGYGKDEHLGYETVRFKWQRPHIGWQDLSFRQAHLNDESREFATTIADQGIVLGSKKQTGRFQYMLRSYMDELRKQKSMSNIRNSLGWTGDHSQFAIGDRLYKRNIDGTVSVDTVTFGASAGNTTQTAYTMAGSATEWAKATAIFEKANMPHFIFAINASFAAPLWELLDLNGAVISLAGKSGAGKSVAQLYQQSIWGKPDKLHIPADFTHNALYNKLGTFSNLPMTIDEATYMKDVGKFIYGVANGRDRGRLDRNAVERKTKEWATTVTVSTNIPWSSKLSVLGAESDAQRLRLLEIFTPKHKFFEEGSTAGRTLVGFIMDNHGVAGDLILREYLRLGATELKRRIKETYDTFSELYGFTFVGEERYWEAECVLQHVAMTIATELGLVGYDFKLGINYFLQSVPAKRKAMAADTHSSFDLVKAYLNEVRASTMTILHTKDIEPTLDPHHTPRGEVKVQFDVYRQGNMDKFDKGTVMIIRTKFKEWLAENGYDYNQVVNEIKVAGADATPMKKRFVFGKGTSLKVGQFYVLGINLNNEEMRGYLEDIQQNSEELTLGELGVVK
jgi:hypothetical protein